MARQDKKDYVTKEIELIIKLLNDYLETYTLSEYEEMDLMIILNHLKKLI